ncbi:hypothetical protein [Rhodoferax sp. UBA5149]|uniref:hypothetical protein n=1 Tax=Rhodoferax sp. UBA5149 TaxID=1947379 RepID=UPI0025E46AC0|nr:hypothetical protein [Rhodoferax sp. UBA5149]
MPETAQIIAFQSMLTTPVVQPRRSKNLMHGTIELWRYRGNQQPKKAEAEIALRHEIELREIDVYRAENVLAGARLRVARLREQLINA